MLRSGVLSRIWRTRQLLKISSLHSTNVLRFEHSRILLEGNDYIQTLYDKLRQQQNDYDFLDTNLKNQEAVSEDKLLASSSEFNAFLQILASAETEPDPVKLSAIQNQFCGKFTDWTKVSQLRVGFLMYLDQRIHSGEYLDKVIRHLLTSYPLHEMGPQGLTALLLLIYFKRDITLDDLCEHIDVEGLQLELSNLITSQKLTQEEICAACLGLKKISGFKVSNKYLRLSLYKVLQNFVARGDPMDDFFLVTVMTTLSRGNMIFQDDIDRVSSMLERMTNQLPQLQMDTVVKLLTFPLTLGFSVKQIEDFVFSDFGQKLETLEAWNLVQICSYISRMPSSEENRFPVTDLVRLLEDKLDNIRDLDELMEVTECFHFLAQIEVFSPKFNKLIFSEINALPKELFDNKKPDMTMIADKVSKAVAAKLNIQESQEREKKQERNPQKTASIFTRQPAFISTCYSLDVREAREAGAELEAGRAHAISRSYHTPLPKQVLVPMLSTQGLQTRSKQLVNCHRALIHFMGSEEYVGVSRLLPHFTEPDLVFGNIGGISLSVPSYLSSSEYPGPRPAPPGDWWVLVVGTRKGQDIHGNIIGQEATKIRQLKKLGYTPIVIPHTVSSSVKTIHMNLSKLLKSENVVLPNLDDGYREKKRKF